MTGYHFNYSCVFTFSASANNNGKLSGLYQQNKIVKTAFLKHLKERKTGVSKRMPSNWGFLLIVTLERKERKRVWALGPCEVHPRAEGGNVDLGL